MEFEEKLEVLGGGARFDLSCACGAPTGRRRDPLDRWIYPAVLPDGTSAPLLKILLTNSCEKDCRYCENRSGRDFRRIAFSPEELARRFMELQSRGRVTGLFLSSALSGGGRPTMDRMIAAAEILRRRHAFRGYLHLKILPGAEEAQVQRAGHLATRVSINLEVPRGSYLEVVAPGKTPEEIAGPLRWIRKYWRAGGEGGRWAPSGFTTQFMVGAAGETDREIMETTWGLYRKMEARRVYFSAFQPVPGTPLENDPACPLLREHRLYQCDFLVRKYGFEFEELPFDRNGNLSMDEDPKTAWARRHRELFPIEINSAPLELLLRVPGIGPASAGRIVRARRERAIRSAAQLASTGAAAARAAPYVLLGGRAMPRQEELFKPPTP